MKSVKLSCVLWVALFSTVFLSHCSGQDVPSDSEFDPVRVVKRFPPIISPDFIKATEAKINDNELVLGVVIEGVARAYPINMLTQPTREIVNDHLGGKSIAATW